MSYVPPALRRKQEAASQLDNQGSDKHVNPPLKVEICSLKDIQKHFWPNWIPRTTIVTSNPQKHPVDVSYAANGLDGLGSHSRIDKPPEDIHGDRDSIRRIPSNSTSVPSTEVGQVISNPLESLQLRRRGHEDSETNRATNAGECLMATNSNGTSVEGKSEEVEDCDSKTVSPEHVYPHNTLNSTEESLDELKYILLFYDANPRWQSDQIIYVKSALDLLPTGDPKDTKQAQTNANGPLLRNVIVFEQQNTSRTVASSMFTFIGYFNLIRMEILEPHSQGLIRMQEQKWTRTKRFGRPRTIDRNAASWKKSLSQRWAVLKLEKDDEATAKLGVPEIKASKSRSETNEGMEGGKKSVNEMLKEMRLKDTS